jgi:hypothetical protein
MVFEPVYADLMPGSSSSDERFEYPLSALLQTKPGAFDETTKSTAILSREGP